MRSQEQLPSCALCEGKGRTMAPARFELRLLHPGTYSYCVGGVNGVLCRSRLHTQRLVMHTQCTIKRLSRCNPGVSLWPATISQCTVITRTGVHKMGLHAPEFDLAVHRRMFNIPTRSCCEGGYTRTCIMTCLHAHAYKSQSMGAHVST